LPGEGNLYFGGVYKVYQISFGDLGLYGLALIILGNQQLKILICIKDFNKISSSKVKIS